MIKNKNIAAYLIAALILVQPAVAISGSREFAKKKSMVQQMKHDIKCALKGDASAEQWARIGVAVVGTAAVIAIGGTTVFYVFKIKSHLKSDKLHRYQEAENSVLNDYSERFGNSVFSDEDIKIIFNPKIALAYKVSDKMTLDENASQYFTIFTECIEITRKALETKTKTLTISNQNNQNEATEFANQILNANLKKAYDIIQSYFKDNNYTATLKSIDESHYQLKISLNE